MMASRHILRLALNPKRLNTSCVLRPFVASSSASFTPNSIVSQRSIVTGGKVTQQAQPFLYFKSEECVTIGNTTPRDEEGMLEVVWNDDHTSKYPYIWLRDNCQCPKCFHGAALSRRVLLKDLDVSLTPKRLQITDMGSTLEIYWSDGHTGIYPADWLMDRSFANDKIKMRQQFENFSRTLWKSDFINQLPTAKFGELLQDDRTFLEFIMNLEEYGLVIVRDAPRQPGNIGTLSRRVGALKWTHYGKTFAVKHKSGINNLAYTSDTLDLHGDLPYLSYKPGVQMLHCISQVNTEGGENHLVDAFQVAQELKEQYPEHFETLTKTYVNYRDVGEEADGYLFHVFNQEPTIRLDRFGAVKAVNLHQMCRDSYFNVPAEEAKKWYEAMLLFQKLLYHPDNLITYKLNEGEIAVFDNNRVLHGRTGYRMTDGERELEGGYWDWDFVMSCKRTLKAKLGYQSS